VGTLLFCVGIMTSGPTRPLPHHITTVPATLPAAPPTSTTHIQNSTTNTTQQEFTSAGVSSQPEGVTWPVVSINSDPGVLAYSTPKTASTPYTTHPWHSVDQTSSHDTPEATTQQHKPHTQTTTTVQPGSKTTSHTAEPETTTKTTSEQPRDLTTQPSIHTSTWTDGDVTTDQDVTEGSVTGSTLHSVAKELVTSHIPDIVVTSQSRQEEYSRSLGLPSILPTRHGLLERVYSTIVMYQDAGSTVRKMESTSLFPSTVFGSGLHPLPPTEVPNHSVTEEEQETTKLGIPLRWVWVPYVFVTIVMIGMVVASFYKFHQKNVHKYRRKKRMILCIEIGGQPDDEDEEEEVPPTIPALPPDALQDQNHTDEITHIDERTRTTSKSDPLSPNGGPKTNSTQKPNSKPRPHSQNLDSNPKTNSNSTKPPPVKRSTSSNKDDTSSTRDRDSRRTANPKSRTPNKKDLKKDKKDKKGSKEEIPNLRPRGVSLEPKDIPPHLRTTKQSDTLPRQSDTNPRQNDTKPRQSDTKPKQSDTKTRQSDTRQSDTRQTNSIKKPPPRTNTKEGNRTKRPETLPPSDTTKKKPNPKRGTKPINFARNANGSMVDLRVSGNDSVGMFKKPFSRGDGYDALGSPVSPTSAGTTDSYMDDEDTDSTLLIQQSQL